MGLEVLYNPATMWKIRKGGVVGPDVADPVVDGETDGEKENVSTIVYGQPRDADFDAPRPPVHRAPPSDTTRKAKNRIHRRNRAAGLAAFKLFIAIVSAKGDTAKFRRAKTA